MFGIFGMFKVKVKASFTETIMFSCLYSSGSQNNLHCNCNGSTSNGTAVAMCSSSMFARKVPNHSPGQDGKRPAVTLTHLPKRPPVDIEFKNLAYSVSEGRKRGWSSKERHVLRKLN